MLLHPTIAVQGRMIVPVRKHFICRCDRFDAHALSMPWAETCTFSKHSTCNFPLPRLAVEASFQLETSPFCLKFPLPRPHDGFCAPRQAISRQLPSKEKRGTGGGQERWMSSL